MHRVPALLLLVLILGASCRPSQDSSASVVSECISWIDSYPNHVEKFVEAGANPDAVKVEASLRTFAAAAKGWHREYVMLRAELLGKAGTVEQQEEVERKYQEMKKKVDPLVEGTAKVLRSRPDFSKFKGAYEEADEVFSSMPWIGSHGR